MGGTDSGTNLNRVPPDKGEAAFYNKNSCPGSQLNSSYVNEVSTFVYF